MNGQANWQENNARYLSMVLARLRERLEREAGKHRPEHNGDGQKPKSRFGLFGGNLKENPKELAPPSENLLDAGVEMTPPPALAILAQHLGLSRFEQEILLLCAAMELDTGFAALCARALGDVTRPYPSFALALAVLDEPAWDALSPERPLRYWRLLEINQPGAQPLTTSPLRADERIVNYLKGLNYLDDRLNPWLSLLPVLPETENLAPSQQFLADKIVGLLRQSAATSQSLPVIQLLGSDWADKRLVAGHAARSLGLACYGLAIEFVPVQAAELENLARLWRRESRLLPLALYMDARDLPTGGPQDVQACAASRLLEQVEGVLFLAAREPWQGLGREALALDVAKPTAAEQQAVWASALGQQADDSPALLAGQFNLGLPAIRHIAAEALAEPEGTPLPQRLWDACLSQTRPSLESLAARIEPKAGWDDLVLPAKESDLLRQITNQVGQRGIVYDAWGFRDKLGRGLGINALFAGPSGAGKTMAAEVIAKALRLNLYRIDLSAVVSKYIGETEKNLRRLFDAAEDGGAILFFDEADALFGKRSEVKDSHDRYANIEVNYLLQRMEAFRGLSILATNLKSALDEAFIRRLRFIVNFPYPGVEERKAIWQRIFPSQTPTEGLDFDRLAKLQLTGGEIRNIALNAAFQAAQEKSRVTMPQVLAAARIEYRKQDKPINEADFRWPVLAGAVA